VASAPFESLLEHESELRELMGTPSEVVIKKQLDALDVHCRSFIAASPFVVIGTVDGSGRCDVSPRGDAAGFVLVLDEKRLVVPDRPGNRRIDSIRNILETGRIGMLFVVPGVDEELRVNGRAWVTRDESLLEKMEAQGKRPVLAIGVEVEECFLHCGKAIKRSQLWDPSKHVDRKSLPSLARMLSDQSCAPGVSVEELDAMIQESYAKRLY